MKYIDLNQSKQSNIIFSQPGDYTVFFKNLSGNLVFDIKSENVNLNIYGIFIGTKNDEFKINTFQNHFFPGSSSNLLIKGVFYDRSKFFYKGLVRIEKAAQKTHAYQKNQNLLMSDSCFVDSKPYLEILANDVFCTHGSTTCYPDRDQIFYLKSRGLDQKKAEQLFIDGFINEVYQKIKSC